VVLEGTWIWGRNGSEGVKGIDLLTSTWMRSSRFGCDMVRKGEVKRWKRKGRILFSEVEEGNEMKLSIPT
jgi:hypothetical protein